MTSRFTYTKEFTKTNFAFGNDTNDSFSIYLQDYNNSNVMHSSARRLVEEGQGILSRIKMPPIFADKGIERLDNFQEQLPPENLPKIPATPRKPQHQKSSVSFGTDSVFKRSAYQEHHVFPTGAVPRRPCTPPEEAEVLPSELPLLNRSMQRDDYSYLGPSFLKQCHSGRVAALKEMVDINNTDAVRNTLQGPERGLVTRFMADYRNPPGPIIAHPHKHFNYGLSMGVDSVSKSLVFSQNGGYKNAVSENTQNFMWPWPKRNLIRFPSAQRGKV